MLAGLRLVVPIGSIAVTVASALAQNGLPVKSNPGCIKHLEIPDYPLLGLQARIQETETVSVLVMDQGSPGLMDVLSSQNKARTDLFTRAIQAAINKSTFRPACAGKAVRLTFHFRLAEDAPQNRTSFQFEPPNDFWITGRPTAWNP